MEENKVGIQKKFGEFRLAQKKVFWRGIRREVSAILVISLLIGLADILFIRAKYGAVLPMTEEDIETFVRIHVNYSISFWWNLAFGVIWAFLFYGMYISRRLEKEAGTLMRNFLMFLIFCGGLYFSLLYGGMLYGLIISCAFMALFSILILVISLALEILSELSKILFN